MEQFPSVPVDTVEKMIDFNDEVQRDIDSRLYGQTGSPWEFNLRDIFRWCQLLTRDEDNVTPEFASKYADILYTQRLRTTQDRAEIKRRLLVHFGDASTLSPRPKLKVSNDCVVVGTTILQRFTETSHWSDVPIQDDEPAISQSLFRPMEAVASCILMNW
jgi:midasin